MDNGLIFPYRRKSAHAEPGDAQRTNSGEPSGEPAEEREPIRQYASDGVTQEGSPTAAMVDRGQERRTRCRQIRTSHV